MCERERHRHREIERVRKKEKEKSESILTDSQTYMHTDPQKVTNIHHNKNTHEERQRKGRRTDRQTDRRTVGHKQLSSDSI